MAIINQVVAGGGTTPTGTISITSNGTHDVTNYATADVQVPTTAPAEPYLEYSIDANGFLVSTTSRVIDFTGTTEMVATSPNFSYSYYGNPNITGVVGLGNIKKIAKTTCFTYMFYGTNITEFDISKLESVISSGVFDSVCSHCSNLTKIKADNLKSITGNTFAEHGFDHCNLTTVAFPSLTTMTGSASFRYAFQYNSNLQDIWFYALKSSGVGTTYTNNFNAMLTGCSDVTVHFTIDAQSKIGSWSDVTAGFGGTNTTVLFDLVTSLTGADGNTYTRQEKDSTTTATAWVYNDTLYYTSGVSDNANGVNEPSVSDAIYSDAACTQSVTTITAIA